MNPDELDMEFQAGYNAWMNGSPLREKQHQSWKAGWRQAMMDEELGLLCLTILSISV